MRRPPAFLLLSIAIAVPANASPRAPKESWGRAGVTFDQYRQDAIACGRQGYYLDIAQTDDAKAFVRGTRELEDSTQSAAAPQPNADPVDAAVTRANQYERIRASVQPERRIARIKAMMQATVDDCLSQKGYTRFQLTDDQRHAIERLKPGSDERRHYLYSLATDPAVLSKQSM